METISYINELKETITARILGRFQNKVVVIEADTPGDSNEIIDEIFENDELERLHNRAHTILSLVSSAATEELKCYIMELFGMIKLVLLEADNRQEVITQLRRVMDVKYEIK